MIESNAKDIIEAVSGVLLAGKSENRFQGITIDSRTLQPGELFFCIRGERFDGHDFLPEVLSKEAAGIVLSRKEKLPQAGNLDPERAPFIIQVEDTVSALQDYAHHHRKRFDPQVVAVTGTNGKSSTKEMMAAISEIRFKTLKSQGNFNNHIGLPLTLFNLEAQHETAVLEMGMSALGEIRRLAEIAEPDIGIITNISEAHLVQLKNVKQVQVAKGELFQALSRNATAIVNADDPLVLELAQSLRSNVITYGINNSADIRAREIRARGNNGYDLTLRLFDINASLFLPHQGRFNIYNALAAIAAGHSLGIEAEAMNTGLQNSRLPRQRMEFIKHKGLTLINDTYNANPRSMKEALGFLTELETEGRRFFVIGDMLELGDIAESAHRQLGQESADQGIDYLITIGSLSQIAAKEALASGMQKERVMACHDQQEAAEFLKTLAQTGDCLLFKGSRGSKMEKVIEALTQLRSD